MKLFSKSKDGGPESNVTAFWLIEWKSVFSVALLRFSNGTRSAYHSHAFNCFSWLLTGLLDEDIRHGGRTRYRPSLKPIWTGRDTYHKVRSQGTSWVLTFRGPWAKTWKEDRHDGEVTLTHGRKIVAQKSTPFREEANHYGIRI
jgi:hypothetical protein